MKTNEIYSGYMYSYPHKTAYRALNGIRFQDYKELLSDSDSSLYFHIPFCKSKCGYCNLFSVTGMNEAYVDVYLDAVETQIKQSDIGNIKFNSFTVGGGDPLILSPKQLSRLFFLGGQEVHKMKICIETSPNETTEEKLSVLKEVGIDRVSIGVQSFLEAELKTLGRNHNPQSALNALDLLKSFDFSCLNLDLIYGIPGQTVETLQYSLNTALKFEPDEIFIYPLYIRGGTGLFGKVINENTYEFYQYVRDRLYEAGYFQISMRQFAKKKPDSISSCGFENMLSIGCGGRSYIGNLHFCAPYANGRGECVKIIDNYINAPDKTEIRHGYILNSDEQKRRFVIKNLFCFRGVDLTEYNRILGIGLSEDFTLINELLKKEYAVISDGFLILTPLGLSLSDYIGPMFISDEVREKMNRWEMIHL